MLVQGEVSKMFVRLLVGLLCVTYVFGNPFLYRTETFRVGIQYAKSLPMGGGSDRYQHKNNYDPFFVTITTTARNGYVISYLDVTASVAPGGEIDFQVVRGSTGSKSMVFQLVSNHSEYLSFQYLAYGITEEEYKKLSNIITIPVGNAGMKMRLNVLTVLSILLYSILRLI